MPKRRRPLPGIFAFLCLAVLAANAGPQGREGGESGLSPSPENVSAASRDLADEMTKLFRRVEQNLRGIDKTLNDASAGEGALPDVQESGLDDLLRRTQADSKTVVSDMDKILEMARKSGGSCCKCLKPGPGSGEGSKSGEAGLSQPKNSQLDRPQDRSPREGEKTPDQPSPEEAQRQKQASGRPETPAESKERGETRPEEFLDQERGDPVTHSSDSDQWGVLPPKVQEIFRNESSIDVPVQYRDWIDSYYRRLGRSGG